MQRDYVKVVFRDQRAELMAFDPGPVGENQLLVKTHCSLVSPGTESAALTRRWDDDWFRANPGYALAGEVVEVGRLVQGYAPGDRTISLRNHASYNVVSAVPWETQPIPDGVTYEQATFSTLLSVAMHGIRRTQVQLGEVVAIFGAGLLGLLALKLAKLDGAGAVICIDLDAGRLQWAKKLGADLVVSPTQADYRAAIDELTHGCGVPAILEVTGNSRVIPEAMRIAAIGGRIVCMGTMPEETPINFFAEFIRKELNLLAAFQPLCPTGESIYHPWTQQENRRLALRLLAQKRVQVDELITHRMNYRQAPEAYELLRRGVREMLGLLFDWAA